VAHAWAISKAATVAATAGGMADLAATESHREWIAEEIIPATTESWYQQDGYGDYLSVEGMVHEGRYVPVCITGRLPTVPPFTELGNLAPCVLSSPLQEKIVELSRRAVDALGLRTCGTHTEIKLMADGRLSLLETAARFGGLLLTRQIELIYGLDLVSALIRTLLGSDPGLPAEPLGVGRCAAGSVNLLGADSTGKPWTTSPEFTPAEINWGQLISPGTRVEVAADFSSPPGTRLRSYDPSLGSLNLGAVLLVEARSPELLLRDAHALLAGAETLLAGPTRR
jgi:biotin carboxylase